MKKEYIKPFAKVKVVELTVMQDTFSIAIDQSVTPADPSNAGAKEIFDFFE